MSSKSEKVERNVLGIASVALAALFSPCSVQAQQAGITRTALQQHDIGISGREAIQARIEFEPGAAFGRHLHPGEELIYVLEGSLQYQVDGKPSVTLKAGDVLFVPSGTIHAAKNVGKGKAAELATYIVEKGKPFTTPVE